jgi:hypothetical protein
MTEASDFVAFCADQIGKPYRWGSDGPEAFDCSGLVQFLLREVNLKPPGDRTAAGLFTFFSDAPGGQPMPGEPMLGCLAFYGTPGAVSHVALCITSRVMIEAPHTGALVRLSLIARPNLLALRLPLSIPWDRADAEDATSHVQSPADSLRLPGAPPPAEPAQPAPFISARADGVMRVIYTDQNGEETLYRGGSRAWRNHNPGNIIKSPFANNHGAIGDDGRMAIFPSREAGRAAMQALLRSPSYAPLSIAAGIAKYAPQTENNTAAYQRHVQQRSGLDLNLPLGTLTTDQMLRVIDAMIAMEGETAGITAVLPTRPFRRPDTGTENGTGTETPREE